MWILSNAIGYANLEQINFLADNRVFEVLSRLLELQEDTKIVILALEAANKLLHRGLEYNKQTGNNPFLDYLDSLGIIKKIEALQEHKSDEVYEAALKILETFCEVKEPI